MTAPHLPDSLIDVAETLGLRVALRLMQEFGGRDLRIPKSARPGHPLVKALGEEDAARLCHFLGDAVIYIPHGRAQGRRRSVDEMSAAGRTRGEIARALGLSERHVRRLANRGDDRQTDLFSRS
ncbi:phage-related hypothetical protein [Rhodovulum sp. P5]|uniref:hypothetical protein n=1 Tax=Rhodovulum sp. P5 TaxID=1564506 RepID=UPI0009C2886C|nr:hypothetical protein [Rhodovulum sp. P5]ARE40893.1 phage-related hypothetical protein [Rhodovulum sp. P5]